MERKASDIVLPVTGVLGSARHVHFVGVGGIGMSGIAELLVNLGYRVSGSDLRLSEVTARLATLGVRIEEGHDARYVRDADVVVFSSAIRATNPELLEARRRRIPVLPRADILAELMQLRYGIAVAGAHGKTTTTSMIAVVLETAGLDPTAIIGGRLSAFGSNARLGRGEYLVAEADESDRSFLRLSPRLAVITNIDDEHLESYRDFADLERAFVQFANRVPAGGVVIVCADDRHLRRRRAEIERRTVTYGFSSDADVSAADVQLNGFASTCLVRRRPAAGVEPLPLGTLRLRVPGRHNVQNALAAVSVGLELGIDWQELAGALSGFTGVDRRFQYRGDVNGVAVVDDYGHHPTEIAAVIATARAVTRGRVLIAFQPHRFSRTHQLLSHFGPAFAGADELVLTDIYAAGEEAIAGVTVEALADSIRAASTAPVHVVKALDEVPATIARLARPGDLVVLLGAGSIGGIWRAVEAALRGAARR